MRVKVKASYYEDDDLAGAKKGDPIIEKAIEYSFIPQAFLNAYIRAYQTKENVYLIIEEINRGNCAQIFGDLFQLLDRDAKGVSEYPIKADADLKVFLEEELGEDNPGIKDGELCLPSNLYIYATMNTSDQSLFPIDSAFKRRWDWKYVPIAKGNDNGVELNWMIEVGDDKYDWWTFVKTINKHVFDMTIRKTNNLDFSSARQRTISSVQILSFVRLCSTYGMTFSRTLDLTILFLQTKQMEQIQSFPLTNSIWQTER